MAEVFKFTLLEKVAGSLMAFMALAPLAALTLS